MIRKIIGFLPAAFRLLFTVILWQGSDPYDPQEIPWNLIVLLALALTSGILLCHDRLILIGCIVGILPGSYLLLFMPAETVSDRIVPMSMVLFYIIYAICYYVYRKEVSKK